VRAAALADPSRAEPRRLSLANRHTHSGGGGVLCALPPLPLSSDAEPRRPSLSKSAHTREGTVRAAALASLKRRACGGANPPLSLWCVALGALPLETRARNESARQDRPLAASQPFCRDFDQGARATTPLFLALPRGSERTFRGSNASPAPCAILRAPPHALRGGSGGRQSARSAAARKDASVTLRVCGSTPCPSDTPTGRGEEGADGQLQPGAGEKGGALEPLAFVRVCSGTGGAPSVLKRFALFLAASSAKSASDLGRYGLVGLG